MNRAWISLQVKEPEKISKALEPSLEKQKIRIGKDKLLIETEAENLPLLRAYMNTGLKLANISIKILNWSKNDSRRTNGNAISDA